MKKIALPSELLLFKFFWMFGQAASWIGTTLFQVHTRSFLSNPSAGRSLDDYLTMADKKMYEIKQMRHKKSL